MSGPLAVFGAVCFIAAFLPPGYSTGVFEVQLTSLINGWGLTRDGLCCSPHNRLRADMNANSDNAIMDDCSDESLNQADHSGNKMRTSDSNDGSLKEDGEDDEEEWGCQSECRTFLRVCLSHLQDPLPTSSTVIGDYMCTFGCALSPVLGGNTLDPFGTWEERAVDGGSVDSRTIVRIPFTFSWPEAYTVVVEAWHDEYGNRSTQGDGNLIARAVHGGRLLPSALWHNHSSSSLNTDLSLRFRLMCDNNYYGPGCDVLCRESDDPIMGHYGCDKNGARVCLPGWEGESCDKAECSDECRASHGFCGEPNKCRCVLGWRGPTCSQCQTFPACLHGYCKRAWQCLCHQGWSGSLCNIDNYYCDRYRPCQNGGSCTYDAVSNYTCSCPQGYGGINCQHSVCYHGYCLNHGVCMMINAERSCQCRRGFQGSRCQHAEVTCGSLSCRNNGTCMRQGTHLLCLCRPGFTGTLCEQEIDECQSNPCRHGGVCRDRVNGYHCECRSGHAGRNCDLALDPCLGFKCFNHGTCITLGASFTPSCLCRPEFSGQRCETPLDPCVGIACLHGGTCLRTGSLSFHCACANGYTGSVCQIPPPSFLCKDQPCLNGGSCRRTQNGVMMCACLPGFQGALCESREVTTASMESITSERWEGGGSVDDGGRQAEVEDSGGGERRPNDYLVPNSSAAVTLSLFTLFLTVASTVTTTRHDSVYHWLTT